jgi:hypothetical protein
LAALLTFPAIDGIDAFKNRIWSAALRARGWREIGNIRLRLRGDLGWNGTIGKCARLVELVGSDKDAWIAAAEFARLLNPAFDSGLLQGCREFLCLFAVSQSQRTVFHV